MKSRWGFLQPAALALVLFATLALFTVPLPVTKGSNTSIRSNCPTLALPVSMPVSIPSFFPKSRPFIEASSQRTHTDGVDVFIINKLMNGLSFKGTFVEFGCADGITNSNTWPLEQVGWYGLCIEANKPAYDVAKTRRANTLNRLIGPVGNFTYVTMGGDCAQVSGIIELYSPQFLEIYEDCKRKGAVISEDTVTSTPLTTILRENGMSEVTYISADCEGCEWPFIQTFNFTEFNVQIFSYEDNTAARLHKPAINSILESHGFKLEAELGDRVFLRKSTTLT